MSIFQKNRFCSSSTYVVETCVCRIVGIHRYLFWKENTGTPRLCFSMLARFNRRTRILMNSIILATYWFEVLKKKNVSKYFKQNYVYSLSKSSSKNLRYFGIFSIISKNDTLNFFLFHLIVGIITSLFYSHPFSKAFLPSII